MRPISLRDIAFVKGRPMYSSRNIWIFINSFSILNNCLMNWSTIPDYITGFECWK